MLKQFVPQKNRFFGGFKMKKVFLVILLFSLTINLVFAQLNLDDTAELSLSIVNQDPDPATTGDLVEVRIGIENIGGMEANDVMVELIPEYPFELVVSEEAVQSVGTLNAYQYDNNMKIIKYKLKVDRDATAGSYEIKIKYYEKGSTITITISLFLDVESKESAEIIFIDQVELTPGKITPLTFTINNVGSTPLRGLIFHWENEDDIILPVGSDNTKYVKYIDIGESVKLGFNVIASANADPDLYKLDLTLIYDDPVTGDKTEINTRAGVYVGGSTDFEVAYSGTSNRETSFSVANIGSVSASSVTIKIPDQPYWRVTGSDAVIIGNLNKGDYTIASFTLSVDSFGQTGSLIDFNRDKNQESEQPRQRQTAYSTIKIDVVYTDSRGNRNIVTKEVSIDASSLMQGQTSVQERGFQQGQGFRGQQQESFWDKYGAIIILVVILLFGYKLHKKYKQEKIKNRDYNMKKLLKDLLPKKK